MSMRGAVQGYTQLGRWWMQVWGDYATRVATKVDLDQYTYDELVDDLLDGATLAVDSAALLAWEAADAAAAVADRPGTPPLTSTTFSTTAAAGVAGRDRRLSVAGPLRPQIGNAVLSPSRITIDPSSLHDGQTDFRLVIDTSGLAGVTYIGAVDVIDAPTGAKLESIMVWVAIP